MAPGVADRPSYQPVHDNNTESLAEAGRCPSGDAADGHRAEDARGLEERSRRARRGVGKAAAWAFPLAVISAVLMRYGVSSGARSHAALATESKAEELCDSCCETDDEVFLPGNDLEYIKSVPSAKMCCKMCRDHEHCLAWSWGKPGHGDASEVCHLKGGAPRTLTKVAAREFMSGQTLQTDKRDAPLEVIRREVGQSMYCFALVQPEGYEKGLIAMQYQERASIFECDEYGVYSNRKMQVAPGVLTSVVNSTLKCPMGGEFGTALNTGIFLAVWAKVIADGRFLYHDWTVKVDPDAVFFPNRLRLIIQEHEEEDRGVYLNNCQFGLHGPLEVFSRNAVKTWAVGAGDCVKYFWKLCTGPCGWGEDMFIDQCLQRKLQVRRDDDFRQLFEDHCSPPKNWDTCENATVAAFHPYKDEKGWKKCLSATRGKEIVARRLRA